MEGKKRVERLESVDKRYTQICEKYKVDTLPLWNKQNCMLIGDIMKTRRYVEDLHLPAEDCKYAISLLTYNQLASEEKSVNDTIKNNFCTQYQFNFNKHLTFFPHRLFHIPI